MKYRDVVIFSGHRFEVPQGIQERPPTTDTYSAPCDQQEFFFRLPFETMDLLWLALELKIPLAEVAAVMGLTEVQVQRAAITRHANPDIIHDRYECLGRRVEHQRAGRRRRNVGHKSLIAAQHEALHLVWESGRWIRRAVSG